MGKKEKSDDKRYGFLFHIEVHVIRIQETPFYGLGFLNITVHVHVHAHERKDDNNPVSQVNKQRLRSIIRNKKILKKKIKRRRKKKPTTIAKRSSYSS